MNAFRFDRSSREAVSPTTFAGCVLAIAAIALTGCPRKADFDNFQGRSVNQGAGADLVAVRAKLDRIDEWNRAASVDSITSELNDWVRSARSIEWRRDPLIDEFPPELTKSPVLRSLGGTEFAPPDVQFLIERRFVHAASQRIVDLGVRDGADLFLTDGPSEDDATDVRSSTHEASPRDKAEVLFDWTIRNVVLQPMSAAPPRPTDASGPSLAVMQRQPGAGYMLPLDQILLRGQGDAWMRMRAFLALCEQQGLVAVALGIPSGNPAEPQIPRLAGVMIGDDLLVFDPALGMPIPNGEGGIATLAELRADPSAWKAAIETASGEGELPREFAFADPAQMIAYIPADPFTLSKRMAFVEQEWTGADRLRLTTNPTAIAERLKEVAGVERSEIWIVPFESLLFESSIADLARQGVPGIQDYLRERQIFLPPTPIYFGRKRYLVGPPPGEEDPQTAKEILLNAALTEDQLDEIETSREVQKLLGYDRILEQIKDPQQQKAFLAQARAQMGSIKKLARYYLGFAQYQDRDFVQAERWFDRAASQSDEGIWRSGSYYNLGRSLEAQGKHAAAASLYRQDKSPQRPMSTLRAAEVSSHFGLAASASPADATGTAADASPADANEAIDPPAEDDVDESNSDPPASPENADPDETPEAPTEDERS